jgi:hypothetical protein
MSQTATERDLLHGQRTAGVLGVDDGVENRGSANGEIGGEPDDRAVELLLGASVLARQRAAADAIGGRERAAVAVNRREENERERRADGQRHAKARTTRERR